MDLHYAVHRCFFICSCSIRYFDQNRTDRKTNTMGKNEWKFLNPTKSKSNAEALRKKKSKTKTKTKPCQVHKQSVIYTLLCSNNHSNVRTKQKWLKETVVEKEGTNNNININKMLNNFAHAKWATIFRFTLCTRVYTDEYIING